MTSAERRAAWCWCAFGAALLAVVAATVVPWDWLPGGRLAATDPDAGLAPATLERIDHYRDRVVPLGLAATAHDGRNPVALREALRARPAAHHLPGELEPGYVLRRAGGSRVAPAALEHVRAVDAGAAHPHEHLAASGLGIRALGHGQLAVLDDHRLHRSGPYPSAPGRSVVMVPVGRSVIRQRRRLESEVVLP